MQPYFLPYIGYWQLLAAVDKFVVLDDVNYIKKGWINRNRILVSGKPYSFTVPLMSASQNRLICDIFLVKEGRWQEKFLRTVSQSYCRAPFFETTFRMLEEVLSCDDVMLNRYLLSSINTVLKRLEVQVEIIESSRGFKNSHLGAQGRIIDICKNINASVYVNLIGGRGIYNSTTFKDNGIDLRFLKSHDIIYPQLDASFSPRLSILDIMMFNSTEKIKSFLHEFDLIGT